MLRRPGFHYVDLERYDLGNSSLNLVEKKGAEIDIKYSGYWQKQQNQIDDIAKHERRQLPANLAYMAITTLSKESREKLAKVQPLTIGKAARIGGVNPADVNALLIFLEVRNRQQPAGVGK